MMFDHLRDNLDSLGSDYAELANLAETLSDATVVFIDQVTAVLQSNPGLQRDQLAQALVARIMQAALNCQVEINAGICASAMANAQRKRDSHRPVVVTSRDQRPIKLH